MHAIHRLSEEWQKGALAWMQEPAEEECWVKFPHAIHLLHPVELDLRSTLLIEFMAIPEDAIISEVMLAFVFYIAVILLYIKLVVQLLLVKVAIGSLLK